MFLYQLGMHPQMLQAKCKDLPDGSLIRDEPGCTGFWVCWHHRDGRFELIIKEEWCIMYTVEIYAISSSFL